MMSVDVIGNVRRAYFDQHLPIKEIVRTLSVSRATVRKAMLRKAAEQTIDGLWNTIGQLVATFTPAECANYFEAAGYDAD